MTARITRYPVPVDGWTVHGKTGTGSPGSDNRYDASRAYGWYVGWATKDQRRLVFATLIQDEQRSEEHTSELQSPCNLVCRLLLEKKKKKICSPFSSIL